MDGGDGSLAHETSELIANRNEVLKFNMVPNLCVCVCVCVTEENDNLNLVRCICSVQLDSRMRATDAKYIITLLKLFCRVKFSCKSDSYLANCNEFLRVVFTGKILNMHLLLLRNIKLYSTTNLWKLG